ncbi:MAG: tRNA 2-thiouridine(34) synthase MnmA [Alphaproteobacteria bacterium]
MLNLHMKPPSETKRVAVAMSGGVDSSVVAGLMKQQGYDVIGVTLAMQGNLAPTTDQAAVRDAKKMAEYLDIPHQVVELSDLFRNAVVNPFAESYLGGETPVPCAACNKKVKFGALWDAVKDLDCDYLITGHYIKWRPAEDDGNAQIWRGTDYRRDQSFFLCQVPMERLNNVRFPLGDLSKDDTRRMAKEMGLEVHDKPDSQDICFVPTGKYAEVVEKLRPGASEPGDIVHIEDGRVLGQHKGIIYYTIGQRRGLEIGGGDPLYVLKLDAAKNQVIVGPTSALHRKVVYIKDLNWIGDEGWPAEGREVIAKTRSSQQLKPARIYANKEDKTAKIVFDEMLDSVAPGQIGVMYDGDRLLGGGWITGAD